MPEAKRRRPGWGWLFSVVFAVAFGVLVFADSLLLRDGELPLAAPSALPPDWSADFPARIERVTVALEGLPLSLPTPTEEPEGSGALRWWHRRYELTLPPPGGPGAITALLDPVRSAAQGVSVQVSEQEAGAQVQIGIDGLLTHTLALHWLRRRPRVAIIIDDLGNDLLVARELADLGAPLTFAVMPFRPFSKEVATRASLLGRDVLLHLPMEAESGEDFGAHEILRVEADRPEIERLIDDSLAAVPHAVGVNNHMGSRFTSDRERMGWALGRLKEKGLFFIDSRTSPLSVACDVAATIALPCLTRTLFLDDTDDQQAIATQLDALLQLAQHRGDAIGIGHPRPATLAALQATVPSFAEAGIDIVPVSTIVHDQSLAHR